MLTLDSEFVVAGRAGDRLSPNFTFGEFATAPGATPRVHLDLISALQMLRDRQGSTVTIRSLHPTGAPATAVDGLFAWVSSQPLDRLRTVAEHLRTEGVFSATSRRGNRLYVAVAPGHLAPISADAALDAAVRITAAFETSGDPYQQVTGNFDGAGLSFGPAQVNFGTGTLVPVFEELRAADEDALRECFGSDQRYREWLDVLALSRTRQVDWADERSLGADKRRLRQPWRGCLQAVGRVPAFRTVLLESAKARYGAKMRRALQQLSEVAPGITVDSQVCVTALYDLCTQQGSLDKALQQIRARVDAERPEDQRALVRIAVVERGATAKTRWRADCISRRLSILDRHPVRVTHSGRTATRVNRNLYLLRGVRVNDVRNL